MIDQEAHILASCVVEHLNFMYQTLWHYLLLLTPPQHDGHLPSASDLHANALMGTFDLGRVQGQKMMCDDLWSAVQLTAGPPPHRRSLWSCY